MNEDLSSHRNRYYPSQVLVPLVVELAHVAGPKGQPCYNLLVFLKIFHSGAISNIDGKNASSAISDKQLPLAVIQDHSSELMSAYVAVDAH